jgi:hypothetical protein
MIQRIQSIWLLLATLFFGYALVPGVSLLEAEPVDASVLADGIIQVWESHILSSGAAISTILSLAAIFLYKHRPNQILLASLAALCQILLVLLSSFYMSFKLGRMDDMRLDWGSFTGFAGVVLIWLAARAIRKDEEKVKSMDRLR